MQKNYLSVLLLFIIIRSVYCQPYEPLVRQDAHWVVATYSYQILWGYENFREYFTFGDTVISDINYMKVYRYELEPVNFPISAPYLRIGDPVMYGVIREDTSERKVYGIQFNVYPGGCFYEEDIMFDFSILQGDSIELCQGVFGPLSIDTVYYQSAFGYTRKHFYPTGYYYFKPLIEGIGSGHGLFEYFGATYKNKDSATEVLMCYSIGDGSACDVITSVPEIKDRQINIYPNPVAGSKMYYKIPVTLMDNSFVKITDIYGKPILQIPITKSQDELNLDFLSNQMYLLWIIRNQEVLFTEKIIKM